MRVGRRFNQSYLILFHFFILLVHTVRDHRVVLHSGILGVWHASILKRFRFNGDGCNSVSKPRLSLLRGKNKTLHLFPIF